jgi:hypothetical protein
VVVFEGSGTEVCRSAWTLTLLVTDGTADVFRVLGRRVVVFGSSGIEV